MTEHQKVAYGVLLETGERLRALAVAARARLDPLTLSDETIEAIGVALNAIHTAQRSMEPVTERIT